MPDKLDAVPAADLREHLDRAASAKAAKRLIVALSYKDGVSVAEMHERYGIPVSTLYYWLDRFEERSIPDAIEDESRPGRPPELTAEGRDQLAAILADGPESAGYDADEWTPELVQRHVESEFSVSYSLGHIRRLMRELTED